MWTTSCYSLWVCPAWLVIIFPHYSTSVRKHTIISFKSTRCCSWQQCKLVWRIKKRWKKKNSKPKGVVSKKPTLQYNFTYNRIAPAQGMSTTWSSPAAHPLYVILHASGYNMESCTGASLPHSCILCMSHLLVSPSCSSYVSQLLPYMVQYICLTMDRQGHQWSPSSLHFTVVTPHVLLGEPRMWIEEPQHISLGWPTQDSNRSSISLRC